MGLYPVHHLGKDLKARLGGYRCANFHRPLRGVGLRMGTPAVDIHPAIPRECSATFRAHHVVQWVRIAGSLQQFNLPRGGTPYWGHLMASYIFRNRGIQLGRLVGPSTAWPDYSDQGGDRSRHVHCHFRLAAQMWPVRLGYLLRQARARHAQASHGAHRMAPWNQARRHSSYRCHRTQAPPPTTIKVKRCTTRADNLERRTPGLWSNTEQYLIIIIADCMIVYLRMYTRLR